MAPPLLELKPVLSTAAVLLMESPLKKERKKKKKKPESKRSWRKCSNAGFTGTVHDKKFFFFFYRVHWNKGLQTFCILRYIATLTVLLYFRIQELCKSRGGRPGLSVLISLTVSVDVKQQWTGLLHWSQFVPNMLTDIRGNEALFHHHLL